MFAAIYTHELRNALRSASFYIYFSILTGLGFLFVALSSGAIAGGTIDMGGGGKVMLNSDSGIASLISIITLFGLVIVAAIAGQATYQETQHNTAALIFTKPISKLDYLGGRFAAAFTQILLLFTGPELGLWVGTTIPWWHDRSHIAANHLFAYVQPYFIVAVPNLLLVTAALFVMVALTRRMLAAYVVSVLALIGYQVANNFVGNLDQRAIAALFDPFGLNALSYVTRFWTPFELNTWSLPFNGILLWNRVLWVGVGLLLLAFAYRRFSMETPTKFAKNDTRDDKVPPKPTRSTLVLPLVTQDFSLKASLLQLFQGSWLQFVETVRSVFFIVVALAGFAMTLTLLLESPTGVPVYPLTYIMLEWGRAAFNVFALAIITFYAGELIWRDRDTQIEQIVDSQPVSTWVLFGQKLGALLLVQIVLVTLVFSAGIIAQISQGYYHFELGEYAHELLLNRLVSFWILCALATCLQVVIDRRYAAYGAMVLYFVALTVLPQLGFSDYLYRFGQAPHYRYSDLDGYGIFAAPLAWFHTYWGIGAAILVLLSGLLWIRGKESSLRSRFRLLSERFSAVPRTLASALAIAFIGVGSFVYYNTHVLNYYVTPNLRNERRAEYEQLYARYASLPEPRITNIDARVELYPHRRRAVITAALRLRNETGSPLREVALTLPVWGSGARPFGLQKVRFEGGQVPIVTDNARHFYLYRMLRPLAPGASMTLHVVLDYEHHGFVNDQPDTQFVTNGTVITQNYLPYIGYDRQVEIANDSMRRRYGLHGVLRYPAPWDAAARRSNIIAGDADWLTIHMVIGTDRRQTAIFPGELTRTWIAGGRRYFDYRSEAPMLDIFSIVSGRYAVMHGRWNNVQLAIYYSPSDTYNLSAMMESMKKALAYCTAEYGPYQFHELRIVEFPRYASFAESLPATIPYSESVGFITRYNPQDPSNYNQAFFVTAHEVAHQWWGHQVVTARTEGGPIIESLAQYTALMVMKHTYGEASMRAFLRTELSRYLDDRGLEPNQEYPLYRVENQPYIYYDKGGQVLYMLAQYVGEQRFDEALAAFDRAYKFHGPPYPTTLDLMRYLRAATPKRFAYLFSDEFTHITLYDARPIRATYVKTGDGHYVVTLTVDVAKYRADGKGKERSVGVHDWFYIGVRSARGKYLYLQNRRIAAARKTFRLVVDGKPARAGIDPLDMLVNRDDDSNMMPVTRAAP